MDVSNYSGPLNAATLQGWKEAGIEKVIVGTQKRDIARDQLAAATDAGFDVEAYVYLYWDWNMSEQVKTARDVVVGFPIKRLWLDTEDQAAHLTAAALKRYLNTAVGAAEKGGPIGIYTAKWWWVPAMKNTDAFNQHALWYAAYDGVPTFDDWPVGKFGGWEKPLCKQYEGDVYLCGVKVDKNVFLA